MSKYFKRLDGPLLLVEMVEEEKVGKFSRTEGGLLKDTSTTNKINIQYKLANVLQVGSELEGLYNEGDFLMLTPEARDRNINYGKWKGVLIPKGVVIGILN